MLLKNKRILLIIAGGIAAYKSLDLIRRFREQGASVRPIMTAGAQQFVTPLAVGALSASMSISISSPVRTSRCRPYSPRARLRPDRRGASDRRPDGQDGAWACRRSCLDRAARHRQAGSGCPRHEPKMWSAKATQRNVATLKADGIHFIGPERGEMAESGEAGLGRMSEPMQILQAATLLLDGNPKPLLGRKAIVTSGPTHEPIDPVRYIANRSSGKQGHAIAAALAALGAEVTLVSGPVTIPDPLGVRTIHVERAEEMRDAVLAALPADIAVMVAAVADWRVASSAGEKIKKQPGEAPAPLHLIENPDILKTVGHHAMRPKLVCGFAAETQSVIENARKKLESKGADMIVANDVSAETGIMGGERNSVRLISRDGVDVWPDMPKGEVAEKLAEKIASYFATS